MTTCLLFTHALAPLHPGTGQGTGVIDLPIAREKATGLPYLPGSSLKGTLRSVCPDANEEQRRTKIAVFGPEAENASDHAGAVLLSDQRLLLLPVRSLAGTFAWVTSPYVLRRFVRDAQDAGWQNLPTPLANPENVQECFVSDKSVLKASSDSIYLEDLDLTATKLPAANEWAAWLASHIFPNDQIWQTLLRERLCIVHDDLLGFLLTTATEITARIRLDEQKKTVAKGGLWYEEALPTETVLAGLLVAMRTTKAEPRLDAEKVLGVIGGCIERPLQLGGKATVGRGLCRVALAEGL